MSQTAQFPAETSTEGAFVRQPYTIRDRITADGSSGFRAEPGRYHLYVSLACPWAHRAVVARRLLGLEDAISMSVVDPIRDEHGWAFRDGPGHSSDPVNGFAFLSEAYLATDPAYTGRYTVPCIWDRVTRRLVTNNFPDITIDFETQFTAYHRPGAPDLYPVHLRPAIDAINELLPRRQQRGL
jgi:putative glutathione S-transferase